MTETISPLQQPTDGGPVPPALGRPLHHAALEQSTARL